MIHRKFHFIIGLLLMLSAFSSLFLACTKHNSQPIIRIGCKNFTEQFILAEIMAQLIENRTHIKVERVFNLGGTMICHNALTSGEIDLYPEYTGTGLTAILQQDIITDQDEAFTFVSNNYLETYQLTWLQPFGFNNTYALTIRGNDARQQGWTTISDISAAGPALNAGFTAEFIERADGYPGLKKQYGIAFKSVKDMDPSLMYRAIAEREVDVICAFSTDGRINAYDLLPLEDDKHFFPPYQAAPVVRAEALKRYPEIKKVLQLLAGTINNRVMQQLNYDVDEKKESPELVAKKFLQDNDLLRKL